MRRSHLPLIVACLLLQSTAGADDTVSFIRQSRDPVSYVLSRFEAHPVVLFGEAHWVREEVGLIRDLIPRLPDAGVQTLAVEVFQASMQATIDAVVSADEWNETGAMAVLRNAGMPDEEYLEIIEAVWRTRREKGNDSLQLLALGPGHDWRQRMPEGTTYDSFMASQVEDAIARKHSRILVYTGLHHAFTQYMQPETTLDGRARAFMTRMGNLLRWNLGTRVFVVTGHRPIMCGEGEHPSSCDPFGGVIDCAATKAARGSFGFDVAGSPFAELRFGPHDLYVAGYPDLRLVDFVDGLIWFAPPEELQQTRLIPIDRFAPTAHAIAEISRSNPFDDRTDLSHDELETLWREEAARRNGPILENRWRGAGKWRDLCYDLQP